MFKRDFIHVVNVQIRNYGIISILVHYGNDARRKEKLMANCVGTENCITYSKRAFKISKCANLLSSVNAIE